MKRKLLLAALCVVGALGIKAQAQEAGTYYIQNVGTGKWLGPGNNWGTQASVLNHADYWKLAKISDGVYTLESVVSNGGTNYYLTGTYCDGGATNFTFTAIAGKENTYSIANASGGYLTANGAIVDVSATNASAEAAQWKLWSEADMAAGMADATVANPFDATYLIKDHDLGRNNRDYSSWSNTGATEPKTSDNNAAGAARFSIEAYRVAFDVNQTLSSVPNGVYALRVNGFGRNDTGGAAPYLYANNEQVTLPPRTGTENNMQAAAVSFEAGNYLSDPAYVQVTDGTLKVGVATTGTGYWVIFKNFHLAYYGDVTLAEVLLAEYVSAYNTALAAAEAYQSVDMFDADKTALNTAISDNTVVDLDNTTQEELVEAAANLNAAAAAAEKAQVKYVAYNNIVTAVTGNTNVDITSNIANLGFEEGNLNGWTSADGGGVATNNNFSGKVGTYFVERWQSGVALGSGSLTHDVITLPAGVYTITANAQNIAQYNNSAAGTGYFLCVNDAQKEIGAAGTYTVVVKFTEQTDVTLKFLLDNCTGNWISCDNVQIVYNGADFPAVTLVEGKMNADVAAAQTAAKTAYDADASVENYNALVDAIAAAQASKDAYTAAGAAIDAAEALQTNHNFVTAAAATTFAEAIAAQKTPYTNNTLTTAEAAAVGTTLGVANVDWHAAATNTPASRYMISTWPNTYTINDWSVEGVNDGSNYLVPFFQDWIADGESLTAKTMTGTLSGLENGLYEVSAWVRVRAKDGVAVADATGITMDVNGGGEGDYAAVDVTEGTQVGSTQFQLATYTAQGLVKDGNLTLNFNIAANNNISWLSFKNVKYTKVRDLTPEEMAVAPTAITLYNGETAVTEAIALNATTSTVTLTPSYTPAEATPGYITWETSDATVATVADGVVTAVSSGTATITATSTLDAEVSATATVTVTYPETEVAEYTNDGATRYVHNYGENLIKNGSFQYPNSFQGWKSGANGNCDANNFNIVTDGDNKYIQAQQSQGAGDSHSISTGWAIEAGKTYIFGYKVKASKAGTMEYLVTSLTNTIGTETAKLDTDEERKTKPVTTSWTDVKYEFTNSDNYAYVQFRARWMADSQSFDDFYLVEKMANDDVIGNVDYATAAIPTSNIGTGAFQYSQDAIDAANALVQGTATVEEVEAAYEALTTLNEPADDDVFNVMITTSDNYVFKDTPLTFAADNASGANFLKNTGVKAHYAQQIAFTKVEGNKYTFSMVNAESNNVYIGTNKTINNTGSTSQIRLTTDETKALAIEIVPTQTEGVYNLRNTEASALLGCQDGDNQSKGGIYTTNAHSEFTITAAEKPSVDVTVSSAKYGTRIFPFAPEKIEGVKYYTCSAVNGEELTLTEVNELAANTPYIIENTTENDIEKTVSGFGAATEDSYTPEGSLLTGVYTESPVPNGSYVLQTQNGKQGFYQVEGTDFTAIPNRAYLTLPASGANVRALFFPAAGEATGIEAIGVLTSGDYDAIYTAGGAKVNSLQKGLNIVVKDGKSYKIFVK